MIMPPKNNEPNNHPPQNVLPDDTLMTTSELMVFLNLSRTKIWTMIQNEGLPAFKFGGDYRFRKSEVMTWMEKYRIKSG
jgi:excisionase family DNA binding protein